MPLNQNNINRYVGDRLYSRVSRAWFNKLRILEHEKLKLGRKLKDDINRYNIVENTLILITSTK